MSSHALPVRPGAALLVAGTAVGLGAALYAYVMPLTGVTDTLGALAAIVVSGVLLVLALLICRSSRGASSSLLKLLMSIGLAANAFAGALLHEWWLCAGMAVGALGLLVHTFSASGTASLVHP